MKSVTRIISAALSALTVVSAFNNLNYISAASSDTKRIIVSLGDSFSSGEGISPYYGQNTSQAAKGNWDNYDKDWIAHRSEKNWPGKLTLPGVNGTMSDHRNENWFFAAASGAGIRNIGADISYMDNALVIAGKKHSAGALSDTEYQEIKETIENIKSSDKSTGSFIPQAQKIKVSCKDSKGSWASHDYEMPFQLSIFDEIQGGRPDYVTLTLSGDDLGFSDGKMIAALSGKIKCCTDINAASSMISYKAESFEKNMIPQLYAVYSAIEDRAGKQTKIIVAGYPDIFGSDFTEALPRDNKRTLSSFTEQINKKLKTAVDDCRIYGGMNIYYVSADEKGYFEGHEAYSIDPYINGLIMPQNSDDTDISNVVPVSPGSVHPNEKGSDAYALAVQDKIDMFENNGVISGIIYKNTSMEPIDSSSKLSSLTALNTETGETKTLSLKEKKSSDNSVYYEEDCLLKSGYFEMILPPGKYKIQPAFEDGSSFVLRKKPISSDPNASPDSYETDFTLIEVSEGSVHRKTDICLEEQCEVPSENFFEWYLNPSVAADDIIVPVQFPQDYNSGFTQNSGYYIIKKNGKYGITDKTGNTVLDTQYDEYETKSNDHIEMKKSSDGSFNLFCPNNKYTSTRKEKFNDCPSCQAGLSSSYNGKQYVYDRESATLVGCSGTSGETANKDSQGWDGVKEINSPVSAREGKYTDNENKDLSITGKYGTVFDKKVLCDFIYDNATQFKDGICAVQKGNKWGYTDTNGNIIFDFEYDATCFEPISQKEYPYLPSEGFIALNSGSNAGYATLNGEMAAEMGTFSAAKPFKDGLAWVKDKNSNLWGIIKFAGISDIAEPYIPDNSEPSNNGLSLIQPGISYVANWYAGGNGSSGHYIDNFMRTDEKHVRFETVPAEGNPSSTEFDITEISGQVYTLGNGIYRSGNSSSESDITGQIIVYNDSSLDVIINYQSGTRTTHYILKSASEPPKATEPPKTVSGTTYGTVSVNSGSSLYIRSSPEIINSPGYGNKIDYFYSGARLTIDLSRSTNEWYYASGRSANSKNVSGYVYKDYVILDQ